MTDVPDPTADQVISRYLEDAFALHPGHMTASGLVARLRDAGFAIVQIPTVEAVAEAIYAADRTKTTTLLLPPTFTQASSYWQNHFRQLARAAVAALEIEMVGRHLNNAIAAIYANVGPSPPLVDIRRAMRLLGIAEVPGQAWQHWNARGETEWTEEQR